MQFLQHGGFIGGILPRNAWLRLGFDLGLGVGALKDTSSTQNVCHYPRFVLAQWTRGIDAHLIAHVAAVVLVVRHELCRFSHHFAVLGMRSEAVHRHHHSLHHLVRNDLAYKCTHLQSSNQSLLDTETT